MTPDRLGLMDLLGNLWELVLDCAGTATNCNRYAAAGGAFTTSFATVREFPVASVAAGRRDQNIGFRIVREVAGE